MKKILNIIIIVVLVLIALWVGITIITEWGEPTYAPYDMPEGYEEFQSNNPGGDVY